MSFYLFLFFVGTFSVYRILGQLYESNSVLKKHMTKIGTACFLLTFAICFADDQSFVFRSTSVFAMILLLSIGPYIFSLVTELQMEKVLPFLVGQLLFQMQLGKSFRSSFCEIIEEQSDSRQKNILQKIFENVVFIQQEKADFRSQMLINSISELRIVDKTSLSGQKRLKNLHFLLKTNSDFRRRSGKILARLRAQAILIGFLYVVAVIFSQKYFGKHSTKDFLLPSLIMMSIGIIWTLFMGRRIRWSI